MSRSFRRLVWSPSIGEKDLGEELVDSTRLSEQFLVYP